MRERPILFSGEMVRAILDGRKTMTRRVMKVQPPSDRHTLARLVDSTASEHRKHIDKAHWIIYEGYQITDSDEVYFNCPYGKVGDRLYVKETYLNHALDGYEPVYLYKADGDEKPHDRKWKSGRFMPKVASRINLEITGVRVERLNEISEDAAKAEGVPFCSDEMDFGKTVGGFLHNHIEPFGSHLAGFVQLWDKINGKKNPWASNPFVWVIEFKKLEQK